MKPTFSDVRKNLHFVGVTRDDYDLSLFPDFLIIGPQRTGTTWLHKNLARHPQLFMPRQKELYYFNNLRHSHAHPKHLPPFDPDLGWYLDHFRITESRRRKLDRLSRRQFRVSYAAPISGEATATYAAGIDQEILREIVTLNPNIKVITMVRDPIERAWSHAKKDLAQQRSRAVDEVSESEWIEFFQIKYQVACGRYTQIHSLWQSQLAAGNLFIGRFIDVVDSPVELLKSIFQFLGVDTDSKYIGGAVMKRVNPTEPVDIPRALRTVLEEMYGEELSLLRQSGFIDNVAHED